MLYWHVLRGIASKFENLILHSFRWPAEGDSSACKKNSSVLQEFKEMTRLAHLIRKDFPDQSLFNVSSLEPERPLG